MYYSSLLLQNCIKAVDCSSLVFQVSVQESDVNIPARKEASFSTYALLDTVKLSPSSSLAMPMSKRAEVFCIILLLE